MINPCISYGITKENRNHNKYQIEDLPCDIQLSIFHYKDEFLINKEKILDEIEKNGNKIKVVHMPLDTLKTPLKEIEFFVSDIYVRSGCDKYVLHPNKGIEYFLNNYKFRTPEKFCLETFAWKKKKVFRTPLEIIDICNKLINVSMTIDTAHIEPIWFDHKIMSHLLKYTKIIHLSNRCKELGPHIPFNHPKGELKLIKFVNDLKYRYKWSGDIVLEYMPEYSHKIIKNVMFLKKLVE